MIGLALSPQSRAKFHIPNHRWVEGPTITTVYSGTKTLERSCAPGMVLDHDVWIDYAGKCHFVNDHTGTQVQATKILVLDEAATPDEAATIISEHTDGGSWVQADPAQLLTLGELLISSQQTAAWMSRLPLIATAIPTLRSVGEEHPVSIHAYPLIFKPSKGRVVASVSYLSVASGPGASDKFRSGTNILVVRGHT